MLKPMGGTIEERIRKVYMEGNLLAIVSIVFILVYGWLDSTGAVGWLTPFLLVGAVLFGLMFVAHMVMMDLLRYGFKQ